MIHPQAGKIAPKEILEDIPTLISSYYSLTINPKNKEEQVAFGTSGHRGSSLKRSFNEAHILAIAQSICDFRKEHGISGPLFLGKDTHGLSTSAQRTALEVFVANDVEVMIAKDDDFTPTPAISHAILTYNFIHDDKADGVVITPSHNPPSDGGFKYNLPNGGPADTETTTEIEKKANWYLENLHLIKRVPYEKALLGAKEFDFISHYVDDLENVINMEAISKAKLKIAVDPMGGSGIHFWEPIAKKYNLNLEIINPYVDPTFSFMSLDKDGKIRMDCSSPYAMATLVSLKENFDIAFGNDPDYDRHGIVTKDGLMNPNHYLAVTVQYLCQTRNWSGGKIGKTLVSSSMIDKVVSNLNKELCEVPVGFKWFVEGLETGEFLFGGEESAGASFLRFDGRPWSTDKDGIILALLAAEILSTTGKSPSEHYKILEEKFGKPVYKRVDAPASIEEKEILKNLSPDMVQAKSLAGEEIVEKLTKAKGNNQSIGGLKVVTKNGWFAARPSGTEDIYKIYGESFLGSEHLNKILEEAQEIVKNALKQ